MARPSDIAEQKVSQLADHPRFPGKPLETSGDGGDSTGMDVVDAKIAAAEARSQTALAGAMGEVRAEFAKINARLDGLPTRGTVYGAVLTAALTVVALLIAAVALGNDMLARGFTASEVAQAAAERALERQAAQVQAVPAPKS